jgi:flagellar M-ring protein FliF
VETGSASRVLTGEIEDPDTPGFPMLAFNSDAMEDDENTPMARLRRLIEERQPESVEILRSWMETDEEEKA